MELKFLKKRYVFSILFLLLFYAINNYIWLKMHQLPPCTDEAYHLLRSLDYFNILTHPSKGMFSALVKVDNLRPPFFHICMTISNIVWGSSRVVSIMANIFFAGVLFFSTYHLGRKMQDEKTGLLATFTIAMYPFIFGLSRMSLSNFASTALVCLSLCCLLYTDRFRQNFPSILLGLFLGLGVLTDLTFTFFIAGPLISIVIIALFSKDLVFERKKIILNLTLVIIIGLMIGGLWYFPRFPFLLRTYLKYGYQEYPFLPELFSFSSLTYYFRSLIDGQISPLFAVLFFIGLTKILTKKEKKIKLLLFSWIIVTYIIFTLIKGKDFEGTSAYLPAFALITAGGILKFQKRWLKRCLIYTIILGGLFQYFIVSYTNPSSTGIKLSFFNGKLVKGLTISSYFYPISEAFFHYPRRGDWRIDDVIAAIQKESPDNEDVTIGVTDAYVDIKTDWHDPLNVDPPSHENFITANTDALQYFLRTNRLSYNVISLSCWKEDWRRNPLLDFIIGVEKIENLAPLISQQYEPIFQTAVPDGSLVYVYKRLFESR